MHDEFLVLIEGVNDLKELQKHAESKYYPEFAKKVAQWFEGLRDERAVRDMLRNEVVNEYQKKVDLGEYVKAMTSARVREDQAQQKGE